jgi:hypothetical protein
MLPRIAPAEQALPRPSIVQKAIRAMTSADNRAFTVPERNKRVTISNGTETREMKYKKAEPLIASGEWKIIG